jgi:hypothetical protein
LAETSSAAEESAASVAVAAEVVGEGSAVVQADTAVESSAAVADAGDDNAAEESTGAVTGGAAAVEETAAVVEQLTAEETLALGELESVVEVGTPDSQPVSQDVGDLDWTTPQAASYSTAQLDSIEMPVANADDLGESSAPESSPQVDRIEEATFNSTTMWTEEETRFTPIDIEAVAVKDVSPEAISAEATGFEFSAVPDEQPVADTYSPVNGKAEERSNGASSAQLSQASIEEIVRRMVAEMSESVVREVAWEVVPDCVERVIEQLTREALSKRA